MISGFDQEFDLQSIPEEVMKGIQDNMKMWDAALQKRNEEIIKTMQEEVKRFEAEYNESIGDKRLRNMPEPKYRKWYFCPCMNGGDGGFMVNE